MGEEDSSSCICSEFQRDKIYWRETCRRNQRQVGWRKELNDLFKACWCEGKQTRIFKNVRYLYAAGELEAGQEEQQIQSSLWRSAISMEHLLFSTIWRMDQNVHSSEKSFRLFLLELSYLLKKLVDLKKTIKSSSSIDPSRRAVGRSSRAFDQPILMNQVSYFSYLQIHCFYRRTNQGKPQGGGGGGHGAAHLDFARRYNIDIWKSS